MRAPASLLLPPRHVADRLGQLGHAAADLSGEILDRRCVRQAADAEPLMMMRQAFQRLPDFPEPTVMDLGEFSDRNRQFLNIAHMQKKFFPGQTVLVRYLGRKAHEKAVVQRVHEREGRTYLEFPGGLIGDASMVFTLDESPARMPALAAAPA